MALVLSPWFERGCGWRSTRRFGFSSPALFTDLVIVKVPWQGQSCATSSAWVGEWAETSEAHIFKLRMPGLKKEDLHIQIEDDQILHVSHSSQPDEEAAKEGNAAAASSSQADEHTPRSGCSFKRKFKLPESSDVEQIKAEVVDETLTVTVPKQKAKSPEPRTIDVGDSGVQADPNSSTSTA